MLKKAYLEITNVCNLSCSFCPGTRREKRFMTPEEFETLSRKLRRDVEYLYLHLMGEPLLHPQLEEILGIAARQDFRVIITTNGTLLDRHGEMLVSSPAVYKVNVSLQSFEGNGSEEPDEYVGLCADFAAAMSAAGKQCVLRLWNKNGLDSLNPRIETVLEARFPKPWTDSRGSRYIAEHVLLQPGERFDWPDMSAEDTGAHRFCRGLRDQIGVLCDGTVVPCCLDHEGDIALGNLFEEELSNIMSTERARRIYDGFSQRQAAEDLCRRCGYSMRFT